MRVFLAVGFLLGLTWVSTALLAQDGLLGGSPAQGAAAPRSVTIDVVIAGGPRDAAGGEMTAASLLELEKVNKLDWVTRLRLATVENDRAHVQVGERVPVVTGRTTQRGGFGGEAVQSVVVSVGTTVEAIPQIAADGSIVIALTAEKSWLEPAAPAAEGGEGPQPLPAQRTSTLNAKATVLVKPGEPTLVTAQSSSSGKSNSQTWIVLTANASGGSKPAATEKEAAVLKVFHLKFAKAADMAKVLEALFDKQPIKASADERTNSVLVQAPFVTMEMVQAILMQLDAEQPKE